MLALTAQPAGLNMCFTSHGTQKQLVQQPTIVTIVMTYARVCVAAMQQGLPLAMLQPAAT